MEDWNLLCNILNYFTNLLGTLTDWLLQNWGNALTIPTALATAYISYLTYKFTITKHRTKLKVKVTKNDEFKYVFDTNNDLIAIYEIKIINIGSVPAMIEDIRIVCKEGVLRPQKYSLFKGPSPMSYTPLEANSSVVYDVCGGRRHGAWCFKYLEVEDKTGRIWKS